MVDEQVCKRIGAPVLVAPVSRVRSEFHTFWDTRGNICDEIRSSSPEQPAAHRITGTQPMHNWGCMGSYKQGYIGALR